MANIILCIDYPISIVFNPRQLSLAVAGSSPESDTVVWAWHFFMHLAVCRLCFCVCAPVYVQLYCLLWCTRCCSTANGTLLACITSCTFASSQNWVICTTQLAISLCPRIWQYHCPLVLTTRRHTLHVTGECTHNCCKCTKYDTVWNEVWLYEEWGIMVMMWAQQLCPHREGFGSCWQWISCLATYWYNSSCCRTQWTWYRGHTHSRRGCEGQVIKDTTDGLQEANQSLGFEFFFMLQDEGGGLGSHLDLVGSQLCSVGLQQNRWDERGREVYVWLSWRNCVSLQQVLDVVCASIPFLTWSWCRHATGTLLCYPCQRTNEDGGCVVLINLSKYHLVTP